MSKNMNEYDKHFELVRIVAKNNSNFILPEKVFGDITFKEFEGTRIRKIHSNAFENTTHELKSFQCNFDCKLINELPNYDINLLINRMTELNYLGLDLNNMTIPEHQPINDKLSKLSLKLSGNGDLTIKTGAFGNYNYLRGFLFQNTNIKRIEKQAFSFKNSTEKELSIEFEEIDLTNDNVFVNGSFDGIPNRRVNFGFYNIKINHFVERIWKSVLDPKDNSIIFGDYELGYYSPIDCDDCTNYWLIENYDNYTFADSNNGYRYHNHKFMDGDCKGGWTLWNDSRKENLKKKCKSNSN